jgi:hypothetical protein
MSQTRLRRKKQPIKGDRSRRVTTRHTCNESTDQGLNGRVPIYLYDM